MKQWEATKQDDTKINESQINWANVSNVKEKLKSLSFNNNGQIITLPDNMEEYIQGKSASSFIGSDNINIESRFVGFKYGNIIVKIRIDEKTNNISIEVNGA
jgi:hypothetical protein